MSGVSLGNMFGQSTMGSNANAPAGTTPSVMGASGKLEAFNPATMADAWAPAPGQTMANLGFPTNQGGGVFSISGPGVQIAGEKAAPQKPFVPPPKVNTPAGGSSSTGPTTVNGPTTDGAFKPITLPTFPQGQQVVNDQWQPGLGTSLPVVSSGLGAGWTAQNNPLNALMPSGGVMPQFFSDGKGGFSYDAAGKQMVPSTVANILKTVGLK